jgi:hypothetical protein
VGARHRVVSLPCLRLAKRCEGFFVVLGIFKEWPEEVVEQRLPKGVSGGPRIFTMPSCSFTALYTFNSAAK